MCFASILRPDPLMRRPNIFPVLVASAVLVFACWYALARWRAFFLTQFFVASFGEEPLTSVPVGEFPPLPIILVSCLVVDGQKFSSAITLVPPQQVYLEGAVLTLP